MNHTHERSIETPFFDLPIIVRGKAPYHVEIVGSVAIICDSNGFNSASFNFDHAMLVREHGIAVSEEVLKRVPVWSSSTLPREGDNERRCRQVADYLNTQAR